MATRVGMGAKNAQKVKDKEKEELKAKVEKLEKENKELKAKIEKNEKNSK